MTTITRGWKAPSRPFAQAIQRWRDTAAKARQRRIARAGLREMLDLDDHHLRDIGVTRGDVSYVTQLPVAQDPTQALVRLSSRGRNSR
ncbi:MAG: DUF1127 domain-containing protein [Rhodobacteraceae bacterium]|jgi:uncharacterized protein YjiS (DUF1127 family)|nr:DUF1127 domain-containing protein [Alphaproteobacteria bacterium]NNF71164.1 DUF1127 domain-containing protein [Paracoccaceae bacterium]NNK65123.1 DUF1127 domain-containing protein [Paracoccaceae bacterium]